MQCYHPMGYQIACNNCGEMFIHGNRNVFKTANAVIETAKSKGWKCLKTRAYDICPKCIADSSGRKP